MSALPAARPGPAPRIDMDRPSLLFLSQCLPYPPHSGVTMRTYNILRQLQQDFDVTLLAFSRKRHQADAAARADARQRLQTLLAGVAQAVPIGSEHSPPRRAWDHLRSVLSGRPYTWYEYDSRTYARELRQALRRSAPALVHVDSLDLIRWLPELPPVPVLCTHHNIESSLLRRRAERMRPSALGAYVRHQADLTERAERRWCGGFACNVMVSTTDADRLRAMVPGARTHVAPNGVDVAYFTPQPDVPVVPGRVAFLGPLYMFANLEGLRFFLAESWDRVRRAVPAASLQTIGHASDRHRAEFSDRPGVDVLGFVPDIRPVVASASCMVVPLRVGGGTRLKILDAWGMGKAVVSTSVGCEGLDVVDGENILVRDDPAEFAEAVAAVLCDERLRQRLEAGARRTAVESYSWDVIGRGLRARYHQELGTI